MSFIIFHVSRRPSGMKITRRKGNATADLMKIKRKIWGIIGDGDFIASILSKPLDSTQNTMASSRDVRDIMGLSPLTPAEITREMIMKENKPKKNYGKKPDGMRRPEGMARELYNLLYNDNKDAPPIIQTDTAIGIGEVDVATCEANVPYLLILCFQIRVINR